MIKRGTSFRRNPTTQSASWILDLHDSGKLDRDPPYQRKSVWNLPYRQFFIDSVVRNFPTQAIFLDLTIDPDAPSTYHVLDGKQRLTALIDFTKDEFAAPDSLDDLGLGGLYYSDFDRDAKLSILNYLFTVEIVSDTSNSELNEAFDRLNRNVQQLNRQELRHAQYSGVFITKMEEIASDPVWREVGVATASRIRRMQDVEYVSEFYIVCMDGVQDGKDYLDRAYANYDVEIPNEEQTDALYKKCVQYIEALNQEQNGLRGTRFTNIADFYSLWSAVCLELREGRSLPAPALAFQRLLDFSAEIANEETPESVRYIAAARQGSNKGPNRSVRMRTIAHRLFPED
ncbi:DUF262 domain-containing protein [Williamsia muralis]|uniref:DUF262 domain-containing protein n=1 Tax=Williamsia marianensis TaxID=85044 RepID=A0ABU4EV71_WILMA|nr:DUF262 domain-containing protein [Williamsia muralis]MDV7134517.1 DUF262 domain-containing protein [Williamsia muralis]